MEKVIGVMRCESYVLPILPSGYVFRGNLLTLIHECSVEWIKLPQSVGLI